MCPSAHVACDTIHYKTMKRLGVEKRDILVNRVRDAQKAQTTVIREMDAEKAASS